jgi:hypothetical protein
MIATGILFIINAFLYTLTLPFRLLPDVVLPDAINSAIASTNGSLSGLNSILPIDTLLLVLGAMIVLEIAILSFKGLNWIIRKIPGVN